MTGTRLLVLGDRVTSKYIQMRRCSLLLILCCSLSSARASIADIQWKAQGPGPILDGQVENIPGGNPVAGPVQAIAPHPADPNVLYIGAVNGGVWRSDNATSANPTWTPLTDFASSLSISSLEFDPADDTHQTLIAGIGGYSILGWNGALSGLLRTTDGGLTWTSLDGNGILRGKNVSDVVARGDTIVASVDSSYRQGNGVYRSTDGGVSFMSVSNGDGAVTGLPGGRVYDLESSPLNDNLLHASVLGADRFGGSNGIYRSLDTGATWQKISNVKMDALLSSATNNVQISAGGSGEIYAAVLNFGVPEAIFRAAGERSNMV